MKNTLTKYNKLNIMEKYIKGCSTKRTGTLTLRKQKPKCEKQK